MEPETSDSVVTPEQMAAYWRERCARWEALVACIEASYDSPSWLQEAIGKVRELNG